MHNQFRETDSFLNKHFKIFLMTENPLVSICIPAYNNGRFIGYTIDSILAQTYKNFELIITDDCSNDDTIAICKEYTDSRIKVFTNESNLGVFGNWNKVINLSQGKYVKYIGTRSEK
jgi:glycosyltransferase involved in cell wall biosynthesis